MISLKNSQKNKIMKYLLAIILFIILNLVYILFSFNILLPTEKYIMYGVILIGVVLFLIFRFSKFRKSVYLPSVLIICSIFTLYSGEKIKTYQLSKTSEKARDIINYIDNYYEINSVLPNSLDNVKAIKPTYTIGLITRNYNYITEGNSYIIEYVDFKYINSYSSKNKKWIKFD